MTQLQMGLDKTFDLSCFTSVVLDDCKSTIIEMLELVQSQDNDIVNRFRQNCDEEVVLQIIETYRRYRSTYTRYHPKTYHRLDYYMNNAHRILLEKGYRPSESDLLIAKKPHNLETILFHNDIRIK
eukprot:TRINITY_DN1247_c0_g1_i2.p1 TRINITY_DN1247_c0_g1~~TRINITY_DN1247_c0_g1_i2.p1  ORF type:complete len:126 (+),score=3.84 TRINITY_DN1247_c0_g1_i2:196-573(+)